MWKESFLTFLILFAVLSQGTEAATRRGSQDMPSTSDELFEIKPEPSHGRMPVDLTTPAMVHIYRNDKQHYVGPGYLVRPDKIAARAQYFPKEHEGANYIVELESSAPRAREVHQLQGFQIHPKFNRVHLKNDVAVVGTDQPFFHLYTDQRSAYKDHYTGKDRSFIKDTLNQN